jgi:hypothetical protein
MSDNEQEQPAANAVEYVLLNDNTIVEQTDLLTEETSIDQILYWIGFDVEASRNNLRTQSLGTFSDMLSLNVKDVIAMGTDWAGRTVPNGKFHIGAIRLKYLQALIHWIQDFSRVSGTPSIVGLNKTTFKSQLTRALTRAEIRKNLSDQASITAKAASPGPLENERQWKQWEEKFVNYARSHIGSNGIPLSYVIRENDAPDIEGEYPDFILETIAKAPHEGEFYLADRMQVFNMLVSFTSGQPSGDWLKSTVKYSDGRRSMQALRAHFAGEGNASRNIAEADRLKESLFYKSERAMTFETFLTQCQKMYNIYEKEGDPMSEDSRIRFLFKKVQHPGLQGAIEALKARLATNDAITYTQAANHISTSVSELPEFLSKNRNISGLYTDKPGSDGKKGDPAIYNDDGSINTGHIPTWRNLTPADRSIVHAERKRLGVGKNKGNRKSGNDNASNANRAKQLSEQNKKYKRQIRALKRTSATAANDENESDDTADAGDNFGGKAAKKKQKK